ncbi:MAG: hypothetical protein GF308_21775 [Candidatus Heimdallarchaeota archaeon]|nr:hypothetical protein [Candidatus Heimdallarchaeota archaeon]
MNHFFSPTKILDSLILTQIVKEGPLHGYALATLFEEKFDWSPSQTAIYNSLKSMENDDLVSVEERIEKGRVQKVYSITKKGKQVFEETHKKMKRSMRKSFSQFLSFVQMIGEIENREESETLKQTLQSILKNMTKISDLVFLVVREAPKETQIIIENAFISLEKLANKYNIQTSEGGEESR